MDNMIDAFKTSLRLPEFLCLLVQVLPPALTFTLAIILRQTAQQFILPLVL